MNEEKQETRPIGVDLFAGAGGLTLGFEQAGFDVLASVELDPIHCATHQFNFPFWSILCQNIVDITGDEIRQLSAIGNREIDVVFGGPPCQGFSMIGKRLLDDPRNSLVFHFIRLVIELQPKLFVMENVPGIAKGKHKPLIQEVMRKFRKNGYKLVKKYQVLNASQYGVPQERKRLFLLGCRKDISLPKYPKPITVPLLVNGLKQTNYSELPTCPRVWDALRDLPEVEKYPELWTRDWVEAEYGVPSDYGSRLRSLYFPQDDYSYRRQYDRQILTSSLLTKHNLQTIKRFEATFPGNIEKVSHFLKLAPEGICNTLRAGTARNRGSFTSPRPIHPFTPRCITVREAARLHSYPDWFRFHGTKWHGFRQVGNSVPPLLAKAVAEEIIKVLGVIPTKPKVQQKLGDEKLLNLSMSQAAQYYNVDSQVIEGRKRSLTQE